MGPFAFSHAQSIEDAARRTSLVAEAMLAQAHGASSGASVVKAGGVDLLDLMKEGLLVPASVTSLRDVPGLDSIAPTAEGGLRIGAMATLARVAADARVRSAYLALADAIGESASPQIRNIATLGGNLLQRPRCWYFRSGADRCLRKGGGRCFAVSGENQYHAIFDNRFCAVVHPSTAATALVAFGASVELVDAEGAARVVLLENFLAGPDIDVQRENDLKNGEILVAITIPPPRDQRSVHLKLAQKDSFDWPLADVAVVLEMPADGVCRRASVVLGAAAPTPHRAQAAEAALIGVRIDKAVVRKAAQAALEGATPLSKNAYKLPIFETLVQRAVLAAARVA